MCRASKRGRGRNDQVPARPTHRGTRRQCRERPSCRPESWCRTSQSAHGRMRNVRDTGLQAHGLCDRVCQPRLVVMYAREFVAVLRFERGTTAPPGPPVPIDTIGGHLHYYRYQVGGEWTKWEPDETLARWDRLPRRLPHDGSARPVRFALRHANAERLVSISKDGLEPRANLSARVGNLVETDFGLPCMQPTAAHATRSRTARC